MQALPHCKTALLCRSMTMLLQTGMPKPDTPFLKISLQFVTRLQRRVQIFLNRDVTRLCSPMRQRRIRLAWAGYFMAETCRPHVSAMKYAALCPLSLCDTRAFCIPVTRAFLLAISCVPRYGRKDETSDEFPCQMDGGVRWGSMSIRARRC